MTVLGSASRSTFNTKTIAGVTSEDFGIKVDTVDIGTKDSVNWSEIFPVNKDGSLSLSLVFQTKPGGSPTQAYLKDFMDAILAFTLSTFTFPMSTVSGDMKFTGSAYVTDVSIKTKNKDVITADVTIKPTGTITLTTV